MEERRMVEQELNLPQDRAIMVRDFLWKNALPENRTYRYKFLSDNCSTRPRDIIEMAAGDGLQYPAMGDTTVTYRDILAHYCRNYAWEKFGIDLVLGWNVDTVIDQRATMFIPMLLMDAVAGATITTDSHRAHRQEHRGQRAAAHALVFLAPDRGDTGAGAHPARDVP